MTIDYDELAKRTERGVKGLKVVHGPGATECGGCWDYDEAMRQYDIQQKRACEAEAREVQLKASVVRWVSKWNGTMDDLTATKGEVARLREALDLYREALGTGSAEHIGQLIDDAEELLSTLTERNARAIEVIQQFIDTPDDGPTVDEYHSAFYAMGDMQLCGHPVESIRSSPYIGKEASNRCGWCEDIDTTRARERERCIAECEVLAQKWFAEQRRSWGMAAGECAAGLESTAAIQEADDD